MTAFTLEGPVTTRLPPSDDELPLRVLCGTYVGGTQPYNSTLNGNLATLFLSYAQYMQSRRIADPLSGAIYDKWIKYFLDPAAPSLSLITGANPAALLLAIDNNRPTLRRDGVYLYLGIYYFLIWYLAVQKDANAWTEVRRYVIKEMKKWRWKKTVKISDDSFTKSMWTVAPDPDNPFNTDRVISKPMVDGAGVKSLAQLFLDGVSPSKPLVAGDLKLFLADALVAFKKTLINVLDAEMRRLLWMIDPVSADEDFEGISWLAVGDGSNTLGFFGVLNIGILFFEYQISYKTTFTVENVLTREIETQGADLPSLFLTYVGKNDFTTPPRPSVSITVDRSANGAATPGTATLQSPGVVSGNFTDAGGAGWTYKSGHLEYQGGTNSKLTVVFGPSALNQAGTDWDEVALLVLSHNLFRRTLSCEISVDKKFLDNEFAISGNEWPAFWSAASDLADLDTLIDLLRDHPDCELDFSGTGNGIGRKRSNPERGAHGPAVESDRNQRDRGISNSASEPRNEPLRYSHGRIQWLEQFGGTKNTLRFTTLGFVSPPRCTWDSWGFFQGPLNPQLGTGSKIGALDAEVGLHLERVPPAGLNSKIRYNTVLCAFRAFSLLEGMIARFKDRIAERVFDSTIDSVRAGAMVVALDVLLANLEVPIPRRLNDGTAAVTLNHNMFHKYAD